MKGITLQVEDALHKKIKQEALNSDITIREYLMRLINKDLSEKSEPDDGKKGKQK